MINRPLAIAGPIAVVGMGCRVPGADTVDEYWQLLTEGRDGVTEVPTSRWRPAQVWPRGEADSRHVYLRWGGFLDDGDAFDPGLFGISEREARRMDPQQGLLLEVTWQALEQGAISPSALRLRNVGVYIGISTCDYDRELSRNREALNQTASTGTSYSICSNRISYAFGLRGPSLTLDAACSSSLIAIHLACQSLWSGESEMALAGGAHLMLAPEKTVTLAADGLLSPDGRCKCFSEKANGYGRGEGAGMVVLMPLEAAVREGHRISGLILGSAINHNGVSNGLSAPSGAAQQQLIRTALARAGLEPHDIGYVEAHGLGMRIGDEIEVRALSEVLCAGRDAGNPLVVGSAKGNFGHLEGAAGVVAFIKATLTTANGIIPPTLGTEPVNRLWQADGPVRISTRKQDWPSIGATRRAGVTSLSFGGANAHVVIQSPPETQARTVSHEPWCVLPLSAHSAVALDGSIHRYEEFLSSRESRTESFQDVCFTAACGRDLLSHRVTLVARNFGEAAQALASGAVWRGQGRRRAVLNRIWRLDGEVDVDLGDATESLQSLYLELRGQVRESAVAAVVLLSKLLGRPSAVTGNRRLCRSVADVLNVPVVESAPEDASAPLWDASSRVTARSLAILLATAAVRGDPIDWQVFFGTGRRVSLPFYPFERVRHWSTAPDISSPTGSQDAKSWKAQELPSTGRERASSAG